MGRAIEVNFHPIKAEKQNCVVILPFQALDFILEKLRKNFEKQEYKIFWESAIQYILF